jgi:hypothetical protein
MPPESTRTSASPDDPATRSDGAGSSFVGSGCWRVPIPRPGEMDDGELDDALHEFVLGPGQFYREFWEDCAVVADGPNVEAPTPEEVANYHGYLGYMALSYDIDIEREWVRLKHMPGQPLGPAYRVWNTNHKDDEYIFVPLEHVPAFTAHVRAFNAIWRRRRNGSLGRRRKRASSRIPSVRYQAMTPQMLALVRSLRRGAK